MEVKEILNTHRSILQKNIVPCEEFYSALIQYNVFTETMIQDIRSQPSRECRVDRLLSLLCLLPRPARVCAALLQSGQAFIANFLEDKFSGEPSTKVDTTDVKEKLPTIRTELPDKGITELKSYIEEKTAGSREEKVAAMAALLGVRGNRLAAFCDALHVTGHAFLADFIRDQLSDASGAAAAAVSAHDVWRRLGPHAAELGEAQKIELQKYIEEKVQQIVLQQHYKRNTKDIDKAMDAKRVQLEENWKFSEIIKDKDSAVQKLQANLEQVIKESQEKDVELRNMSQAMISMKAKHDMAMKGQLQYNDANDNTLRRMHDREVELEKALNELMAEMEPYVEKSTAAISRSLSIQKSEDMAVTHLDKTKVTLAKLLKTMDELLYIRDLYNALNDERYYIMGYFGYEGNHGKKLKEAFQEYIIKNDSNIEGMKKEISRTADQNRDLSNQLSQAQKEIEELKKENAGLTELASADYLQKKEQEVKRLQIYVKQLTSQKHTKDEKIKELDEEILKLKALILKLEKQVVKSSKRPTTPRFRDFSPQDEPIAKTPNMSHPKESEVTTNGGGKHAHKPKIAFKKKEDQHPHVKAKQNGGGSFPRPLPVNDTKSNGSENVSLPPIYTKGHVDVRPTQPVSSMPRNFHGQQGMSNPYGALLNITGIDSSPSPTSKGSGTGYFHVQGITK